MIACLLCLYCIGFIITLRSIWKYFFDDFPPYRSFIPVCICQSIIWPLTMMAICLMLVFQITKNK